MSFDGATRELKVGGELGAEPAGGASTPCPAKRGGRVVVGPIYASHNLTLKKWLGPLQRSIPHMASADLLAEGPPSWANWRAYMKDLPSEGAYEVPLYTDAHITGMIQEGYGPYQFLNTVPMSEQPGELRPAVVLRVWDHFDDRSALSEPMTRTDDERYHGGWLNDEVAALASLSVGIRLKPGRVTREFRVGEDPQGRPIAFGSGRDPVLLPGSSRPVLPRTVGTHSLDALTPLLGLPTMEPADAIVLVRAARLYQDGVWIADTEPELSWIMLVSAIEAAAGHWRAAIEAPLDRLRASRPELEPLLWNAGGEALVLRVAEEIAPYMGATKKFVDFIMEFLPEPPEPRPDEFARHSWEAKELKKSCQAVYNYRSRALHGGSPFPAPMCEPPFVFGAGGVPTEIPIGGGMRTKGGTWLAKDTPILLHTFEYIVRGALLRWWRSMVPLPQRS
jgi:hypothetical protein